MKRLLITGMSGMGKTSAIDTDSDEWCEWVTPPGENAPDWVWREDRIRHLLTTPRGAPLFLSGCKTNQGQFYGLLDGVVLLSAPVPVMLERLATRTNNPYGKSAGDRARILEHVETVLPLLRRRATLELDTSTLTVVEVADRLVSLTGES